MLCWDGSLYNGPKMKMLMLETGTPPSAPGLTRHTQASAIFTKWGVELV